MSGGQLAKGKGAEVGVEVAGWHTPDAEDQGSIWWTS
jgi:hypothetical protein